MTHYTSWQYGEYTTNAAGVLHCISETEPSGTIGPTDPDVTLSVDADGVVTISSVSNPGDLATYRGFLSADKKTIVGTYTEHSNYKLMVIQITGQAYTAGPVPDHISAVHVLAAGTTAPAPFWAHGIQTISGGLGAISTSDWVPSNPAITAPAEQHVQLSASGTVTVTEEPSYHGQVSHDGTFSVGTLTACYATPCGYGYLLTVHTIKTPWASP